MAGAEGRDEERFRSTVASEYLSPAPPAGQEGWKTVHGIADSLTPGSLPPPVTKVL